MKSSADWARELEAAFQAEGFRLTRNHRVTLLALRDLCVQRGTALDAGEVQRNSLLPPRAAAIAAQALQEAVVEAAPAADPNAPPDGDPRWAARPEDPPTIAALRGICRARRAGRVQHRADADCLVDMFSASAVVQVYDAISTEKREKFLSFHLPAMVKIAFGILARTTGR